MNRHKEEQHKEEIAKEATVLDSLIYRSKNQHKSSLILRKMIELKRLLRRKVDGSVRMKILKSSKELYTASSADISMGFFIPLNLCILGVSARIFYLIERKRVEKVDRVDRSDRGENEIDRIFRL